MPYQVSLTESTTPIFATFLKGFVVVAAIGGLIILGVHTYARETYWFLIGYGIVLMMIAALFGLTQYLRIRRDNRELTQRMFDASRESREELAKLVHLYRDLNGDILNSRIEPEKIAPAKKNSFPVNTEPSPSDKELTPEEYKWLERKWKEERENEKKIPAVGFIQGHMRNDSNTPTTLSVEGKNELISRYLAEARGGRVVLNDLQKFAVWKRIAEDKLSTVDFMQTFNRIK